ncbi:MAG: NAD-dependent epimerase/dehydratase family protein [Pseudomonadota bacterium]
MDTIVVGATGALGFEICKRLRREGASVLAIHRKRAPRRLGALQDLGCETRQCDISRPGALAALAVPGAGIILTPILTTSGPALRSLDAGVLGRAVLFSSNNVHLRTECPKYDAIRAEEAHLAASNLPATIIRPTMIYGHAHDGNVARVMALARRSPIVPVPGYGAVRCQPIHVEDLAALATEALRSDAIGGYVLAAGPEPMPMNTLMRKIGRAAGATRAVVPVPLWLLRAMSRVVRLPLDAQQLSRAKQDRIPRHIPAIPGWRPMIGIDEGLQRLVAALDAEAPGPHIKPRNQPASGAFNVGHSGHPVRHR